MLDAGGKKKKKQAKIYFNRKRLYNRKRYEKFNGGTTHIGVKRLRWAEHLRIVAEVRTPKSVFNCSPTGKREMGRSCNGWKRRCVSGCQVGGGQRPMERILLEARTQTCGGMYESSLIITKLRFHDTLIAFSTAFNKFGSYPAV